MSLDRLYPRSHVQQSRKTPSSCVSAPASQCCSKCDQGRRPSTRQIHTETRVTTAVIAVPSINIGSHCPCFNNTMYRVGRRRKMQVLFVSASLSSVLGHDRPLRFLGTFAAQVVGNHFPASRWPYLEADSVPVYKRNHLNGVIPNVLVCFPTASSGEQSMDGPAADSGMNLAGPKEDPPATVPGRRPRFHSRPGLRRTPPVACPWRHPSRHAQHGGRRR